MNWKAIALVVLAGLFRSPMAEAESFDFRLKLADSLFNQRKFTQSLAIYKEIFDQKSYSPAMLLRMAYVEEGLGHTALSLYYLNVYYQATRNEQALEKMEETANALQLKGYEITPFDRFLLVLAAYRLPVIGFLALGTILFGISVFRQHGKDMQWFIVVVQFVFGAMLLFFINIDLRQDAGIVSKAPVYVMSGPSSGAKVVAIIGNGHRLEIDDKEDVWVKVSWEGREGWVREGCLLRL
jgi:hypothetical protein